MEKEMIRKMTSGTSGPVCYGGPPAKSWYSWFMRRKPRKPVPQKPVLRVTIEEGEGGRQRWFARNEKRIVYSCFPNSFGYKQQAWEDAEWACGASVTLVYEHPDPDQRLELYAGPRDFQRLREEAKWHNFADGLLTAMVAMFTVAAP